MGHRDELGRYQTFSVPMDDVYATIDGNIGQGNGWSSEEFEGNTHWLEFGTESARATDTALIILTDLRQRFLKHSLPRPMLMADGLNLPPSPARRYLRLPKSPLTGP